MECLVRVWEPPVTNAGFIIVRPTVTIYGEELTTKCGKSGVNAFYCTADQQVYYSNLLPEALPTVRKNKWTADIVMAHEFGHALQGRTGILISAHALGQNSGDEATELQYTRRLETQADCFSGMFIRAVSQSIGVQQQDVDGILDIYDAIGDDKLSGKPDVVGNHGLARSRKYWGTTGLGTSAVGECNTFVVPSRLVRYDISDPRPQPLIKRLEPVDHVLAFRRGMISDQERGCDCRDAFTTACQPKAVCGGRRKTDRGADRFTHHQLGLGTPRVRAWDGHRSAGRQCWRCQSQPLVRAQRFR